VPPRLRPLQNPQLLHAPHRPFAPLAHAALSLPQKAEENSVRFLTPTENKRLNELIGFLCIMTAVLMGLSLLTYNPRDVAFNVSAAAGEQNPTRNWIGPAGAYSADVLFQAWIRGVSAAGGDWAAGVPVVPQPAIDSQVRRLRDMCCY